MAPPSLVLDVYSIHQHADETHGCAPPEGRPSEGRDQPPQRIIQHAIGGKARVELGLARLVACFRRDEHDMGVTPSRLAAADRARVSGPSNNSDSHNITKPTRRAASSYIVDSVTILPWLLPHSVAQVFRPNYTIGIRHTLDQVRNRTPSLNSKGDIKCPCIGGVIRHVDPHRPNLLHDEDGCKRLLSRHTKLCEPHVKLSYRNPTRMISCLCRQDRERAEFRNWLANDLPQQVMQNRVCYVTP